MPENADPKATATPDAEDLGTAPAQTPVTVVICTSCIRGRINSLPALILSLTVAFFFVLSAAMEVTGYGSMPLSHLPGSILAKLLAALTFAAVGAVVALVIRLFS